MTGLFQHAIVLDKVSSEIYIHCHFPQVSSHRRGIGVRTIRKCKILEDAMIRPGFSFPRVFFCCVLFLAAEV